MSEFLHEEVDCLSRWIDDQRITIEAVEHDRVLSAEIVHGQTVLE